MIPDGDYLVRERWPLSVQLSQATLTGGPAAFPTFRPSFIDRHIRCRARLYEEWEGSPPARVLETFGGLGLTSTIIRGELTPKLHEAWEWYPALAAHLRANGFRAHRLNSMHQLARVHRFSFDLIDADFGHFTVHAWRRDQALAAFCQALFTRHARWIVTTDESNARMHLHLERYGAAFGRNIKTQDDYVNGLSWLFSRLYGYSVLRAVATHGATSLLWTRLPYDGVTVEEPAQDVAFRAA